jgi:hypothetical protein
VHTINLQVALATMHKCNMNVTEYVSKMKNLGDDMLAASRKLDDEELVEYILSSPGEDFNSVVSTVCGRVEPIPFGEIYAQLLHYESRQ